MKPSKTPRTANYGQQSNPLSLFRGPLIILGVTSALLAPYLTQLSLETVGLLTALVVGLCVTIWDVWSCVQERLRSAMHRKIDNLVLDDLLRAVFDPEVGVIACWMASFLGSSAMYLLATTNDQRVRLLQSGLWLRDPEMARKILYQPGGIKLLLPESLVTWMQPPQPLSETEKLILDDNWEDRGQESLDNESATAIFEDEKQAVRETHPSLVQRSEMAASLPPARTIGDHERTSRHTILSNPPMPHEVLGSIMVGNIKEKFSSFRNRLPHIDSSTVGISGGMAALLLLIQLRSSQRARNILLGSIQSLTLTGLSSIVMASGTMLLSKNWTRERQLSYETLKNNLVRHVRQHWRRYATVLFLLYMRRRQIPPRRR